MSRPTPLATKLVGGIVGALGEHALEQSPELRALAHAVGWTAALPPSQAERRLAKAADEAATLAEGVVEDAIAGAAAGLRARLRAKAAARRGEKGHAGPGGPAQGAARPSPPPPPPPPKDQLREQLRAVFESLSPLERDMVEAMLREKHAPEEVIDLVRQRDGSFAPKEKP